MAHIIILGAAGFIGTNLVLKLAGDKENTILAVDCKEEYLQHIVEFHLSNVFVAVSDFTIDTCYDKLLVGQDIAYHLFSTTVPTTSNQRVADEVTMNVSATAVFLDACVRCGVGKVVFISSGGTVYGKEVSCPIKEDNQTNPISSYGIQKLAIEKLLYLYNYTSGLDYKIIRLANPYGPYQRPNGVQGVVTTFIYKALQGKPISVYGDGTVVRDYIYIEDAIDGILNIVCYKGRERIFNLGSGVGVSVKQIIFEIQKALELELKVEYLPSRKVDVPENYLNIERYKEEIGEEPVKTVLTDGIKKTAVFLRENELWRTENGF